MDGWYYKLFGDEYGPVTFDELVELAKSHSLSSDDEVRLGEVGVWRRAGSIGKLMAHLPYQAPKKTIAATANAQEPENRTSIAAVQNASAPQWPDDDSFETLTVVEPPRVEDRWWCKILDTEIGPVTFDELVEHAKNHTLSSDDEVRFGENGQWRRAGSLGSLMAHFPFQAGQRVISTNTSPRVVEDRAPVARVQNSPAVENSPAPGLFNNIDDIAAGNAEPTISHAEAPRVDTRWWCKIQDLEYGPVDLPKVMEWVASGRLHAYDYVRVGRDPYILASELPDLFPKPKEIPPAPRVQPRPVEAPVAPKPVTEPAMSTLAETSPAMTSAPERKPYTPSPMSGSPMSGSGGFGAGGGMNRPAAPAPVRRPAPAKSSVNIGAMLTGPVGLGAGGVILLGLLIYFVLPLISGSNSADVKRFKSLQAAFKTLTELRRDKDAKPEAFKEAASKIEKAAKKVVTELKTVKGTKKSPQKKLQALANKLLDLAKEDLTKPNSMEIDLTGMIGAAGSALGVK